MGRSERRPAAEVKNERKLRTAAAMTEINAESQVLMRVRPSAFQAAWTRPPDIDALTLMVIFGVQAGQIVAEMPGTAKDALVEVLNNLQPPEEEEVTTDSGLVVASEGDVAGVAAQVASVETLRGQPE